MKKILTISLIALGLAAFVGFGAYKIFENASAFEEKANPAKAEKPEDKNSPYATKEEEVREQTGTIRGIEYTLKIPENAEEKDIVSIMHKMTHQKVRSQNKWGAIPMIPETVQTVLDTIHASSFDHKVKLQDIAEKWKNEDFSSIDKDHNYFWTLQGGTVGEAYGIMNKEEEEAFIQNNFKQAE